MRSKLSKMRSKLSKMRSELSKTVLFLSKTQSNGRVKPVHGYNQPRDPETRLYSIPLGSPTTCSKRPYVHVPVVPYMSVHDAQNGGAGRVGIQGGYTGWVSGWVIRGCTTQPPARVRKSPVQRSGPRNPCRGWSGWYWGLDACPGCTAGGDGPGPPCGPGRVPWPLPVQDLANTRLLANKARFGLNS